MSAAKIVEMDSSFEDEEDDFADDVSTSSDDGDDVHVPCLRDDEDDDEYNKELQAALAAGLIKPGTIVRPKQQKPKVNKRADLDRKLKEISTGDLDWVERLDITVDITEYKNEDEEDESKKFNVDNDFKRELLFYEQAKSSALLAVSRLHKEDIPTKRPDDYFAEMAKKDDHMKKLRQKLTVIRERKEKAEQNKKNFELRKYGKKVQQQVTLERQKKKREMLQSVKKYQKGKTENLDFLEDGDAPAPSSNKGDKKMSKLERLTQNAKVNNKRLHKNKKFGFGGRKRNMKSNDKESHSRISGFKKNVHGNKKSKRPGKNRRAQNKK